MPFCLMTKIIFNFYFILTIHTLSNSRFAIFSTLKEIYIVLNFALNSHVIFIQMIYSILLLQPIILAWKKWINILIILAWKKWINLFDLVNSLIKLFRAIQKKTLIKIETGIEEYIVPQRVQLKGAKKRHKRPFFIACIFAF